ncbi:unnamed protein product [Cyprideis torosa]|uniref:Thymidine phosphorylase n=1 Tax=Cyprideis torosa TaxID=163714 RepID=A0A7R8WEI3_9CRUS|nr:unnamed protein product [Cyprideis torosa]CAG0890748.1 unnamed protein product [Cyprideis torosa]
MVFSPSVQRIIGKKRDREELDDEDIQVFIQEFMAGKTSDYQLGALVMAFYLHGLTLPETISLTRAMTNSGPLPPWPPQWRGRLADKHSTGGVGDKVSIPLVPILASLGLKVPMISGRSLGFTGGTLNKLESIPGFRVDLSFEEMRHALETAGGCIVGQTEALVPADKAIYACRDQTGTVGSRSLIISSILSKKAAEGIDHLVLDVKFGRGSYQTTQEEAETLASELVEVGKGLGLRVTAFITRMTNPIGRSVGNSLEILESVQFLAGTHRAPDLQELVFQQGGELMVLAGICRHQKEAEEEISRVLNSGEALRTFQAVLECQGVSKDDARELCFGDPWQVLPRASNTKDLSFEGTQRGEWRA